MLLLAVWKQNLHSKLHRREGNRLTLTSGECADVDILRAVPDARVKAVKAVIAIRKKKKNIELEKGEIKKENKKFL